jgi:N-acetylgalactosamine kinase
LQAAIALNNFELTSRQFIDLCGQGEWFVGSRGGAGDHAAIYLGQRGKIAQVGYHPFRVEKIIEAPFDYQIIIADSHIKAAKSESARSMFNSRIAAYNIGLALFKQLCPEVSQTVEHVRDIDPAKLGISISSVYEMLLKVPEQADEKYLRNILSSESISVLEENLSHHDGSQKYNLRGVLLFGASEVLRSRLCPDLLQAGEIQRFGELMKISHDGDRVSVCDDSGKYVKMADRCSDQYLGNLISDLRSESPERVLRAQLYNQPGCYSCSTVEIDKMVDIACSVQGVAGAQIAGAGLGGCIMILSRKESVDEVKRALVKRYYRPAKLEPAVLNCITVEGAGLAEF